MERIAEAKAVELADKHGIPRSISAVDALQEELDRTQGRIDWYQRQLTLQPHDGALLAMYSAERNHPRQLAGGMVTSKVDEPKALVAEQTLDNLQAVIEATLRDLRLDPHSDRVRRTMARHLAEALETGNRHTTGDVIDAEVSDEPIRQPVPF